MLISVSRSARRVCDKASSILALDTQVLQRNAEGGAMVRQIAGAAERT
jgi:hypothetical protein